jgi:purine-binding chemotaxis protein CheW
MAQPSDTNAGDTAQLQLVSFRLGTEEYGIDILSVQEINRLVTITRIPQASSWVLGVINLRGRVVPVVDLRIRLGLDGQVVDNDSRIIVCDVGGTLLGMVVDSVSEVLRIDAGAVDPPPVAAAGVGHGHIKGVVKRQDQLLLLLDVSRVAEEASVWASQLTAAEEPAWVEEQHVMP